MGLGGGRVEDDCESVPRGETITSPRSAVVREGVPVKSQDFALWSLWPLEFWELSKMTGGRFSNLAH